MPSSRPNAIPTVVHLVRQLQPRSILDVGVGFGKWGHLFREYTDIIAAEREPPRYRRERWQVRIEGIEGHAAYLTPMHEFLYDQIHVGDAAQLLKGLRNYDLIFFGDVIEHFEKATGAALLREALDHAQKAVIVCTPKFETLQENLCGNELERHRCLWSEADFQTFPNALVTTVDDDALLAVLRKTAGPKLKLTPQRQPTPAIQQRLRRTIAAIATLLPRDERFVLVDEEQVRGSLPHAQAVPFLENAGQYWGPPPDAATAISELERLRATGASHLVFTWVSFWWLDYYGEFAAHVHARYPVVQEDELLRVFDLR